MDSRDRTIRSAVAARDRNRRRLRAVTATIGLASIVAGGAVAAELPGSTHAQASSSASRSSVGSGSSSGGASAGSGSSSAGSGSGTSSSSGLSQSSAPSSSSGSSQVTSGGS